MMRAFKSQMLVSVALCATWSANAAAQTNSGSPVPPAAPTAAPTDTASDDIVVTGVRASIERAQELKRRAPSVIEAITAQDIGKFTDSSVADALQRIPGVTIDRNYRGQDQGDGVNIRGLGRAYVQTTVNGRELLGNPDFFGGSGRNFDFGSIPPDILGSILIYKTPTASIVESGLAGEVDQRTIRPLDVKRGSRNYFGSLTAAAFYDPKSAKLSPQLSGVIGTKLFGGTLGLYVAGVHSREKAETDQLFIFGGRSDLTIANTGGGTTTFPNINVINGLGSRRQEQNYKRDAIAAGLQWKPSDRLEVNADFLYNRYQIDLFQRNSEFIGPGFVGQYNGTIPASAVQIEGQDLVYVNSALLTGTPYQRAGFLHDDSVTKNYNLGLNAIWRNDSGLEITADGAYGKVDYTRDWLNPYLTNEASGGTDIIFDARNGQFPTVSFSGPATSNISNPASYNSTGLFRFQSVARNTRVSGRLDIEQAVTDTLKLRAGGRYTRTTSQFINAINERTPSAVGTAGFFNGVDVPPIYPVAVPRGDLAGICASNRAYCDASNFGRGSFSGGFPTSIAGSPDDLLALDAGDTYRVVETKWAAYGEASFDGTVAGLPVSGNIGIRAVNIDTRASAFQGVQFRIGTENTPAPNNPSMTTLFTDSSNYWRYLPSLNITVRPADRLNLRFGAAKTISPAQYADLAPRGTVTIILPNATGGAQRSFFSGGNTQLAPTQAWNFDITAEYYTRSGGALIASLFYKDVRDLVQTTTRVGTLTGQGARSFDITSASNAQTGRVYGFELGGNQPLTFLPGAFSGLGVQANYTYVDAQTRLPVIGEVPFGGSSKHNANVAIYYEKSGWNARLAYFYRSRQFAEAYSAGNNRELLPQYSLDLSVSKKITDYLEVRINAVNLTKRDVYEVTSSSNRIQNYYERPRTFLAGFRLSM